MAAFTASIDKINKFQQQRRFLGFVFAVIKKYSDDNAGKQAALLTYYAFLSVFPLLLILVTITDVLWGSHSTLRDDIIHDVTSYFPLLGNQLSQNIHRLHSTGITLVVGLLFTLYGVRGVASVFRTGVQDIWQIPENERDKFPETLLKSLVVVVVGGLGFILASVISGAASDVSGDHDFRIVPILINIFLLFWLFNFLISFNLPRHIPYKKTWEGALVAAVGLVILQSLGAILLGRELKRLDALYSYFAVALGLMFWLYLQAQVLYYSFEIAVVKAYKLYPVNLKSKPKEIPRSLP
ncbi:MAG TPA: YihY/virulence factor BrkB family protein [Candidatus Sulfotelmatobacter sp.]|nr:YihY/virulence factor BrkB family protein [Candidatus Sulfotelmatobacter sp.]